MPDLHEPIEGAQREFTVCTGCQSELNADEAGASMICYAGIYMAAHNGTFPPFMRALDHLAE